MSDAATERWMLRALWLLFAVSGFTALIYESVWSHYLGLLLGHAAYAQTAVLAIFMGGLAAGAWLAAAWSQRLRNPLLAYALVEGGVGLLALAFHGLFDAASAWALAEAIPSLDSLAAIQTLKVVIALALMGPPAVLLGMTFPLLSAAALRRAPQRTGESLAMLYFSNALGGAVGVLVSGFALIAWAGLPGTVKVAGMVNLALAAVVLALAMQSGWRRPSALAVPARGGAAGSALRAVLLTAALLTGAASLMYEVVWIRMLNLVLGTTTHSFELMLSAFILGLALGGLWIRRRIDTLASPLALLGWLQVIMGVLALATLFAYGTCFEVMAAVLNALARNAAGYVGFTIASHGIALAIMLPATVCAGMTLPVITNVLVTRSASEHDIGVVYGLNTAGAIAGAVAATHAAIPLLGLQGALVTAAFIDVATGLVILCVIAERAHRIRRLALAALVGLGAIAATVQWAHLDPRVMASGVFRYARASISDNTELVSHRDGKTATVSLVRQRGNVLVLNTNGKPDVSIAMGEGSPPSRDEYAMVLTGVLPVAAHPGPVTAAVIGMGSGLTTHALLGDARLERVDTIEIESAMVVAAQAFRPRVERAFSDPRSRIHLEDARSFLAGRTEGYDLIVSMPSNPWVSGVSSLFSLEFYGLVRQRLRAGGVLAQWLQLYEIDLPLVATIVGALATSFEDYAVYAMDEANVIILAGAAGASLTLDASRISPALAMELEQIGIRGAGALQALRVGGRRTLGPLFEAQAMPANSDYFPVLERGAVRARFMTLDAFGLGRLASAPLPLSEMLEDAPLSDAPLGKPGPGAPPALGEVRAAQALLDFLITGRYADDRRREVPERLARQAQTARMHLHECRAAEEPDLVLVDLVGIFSTLAPRLPATSLELLWRSVDARECLQGLPTRLQRWAALFRAVSRRDAGAMVTIGYPLLLNAREREDQTLHAYLTGAVMLGALANNDPERARRAWYTYAPRQVSGDETPPLLRVLRAIAVAGPDPTVDGDRVVPAF